MSSKTRLIIIDYDFFEFEGIVSSSSVVIAGPTLFLSSEIIEREIKLLSVSNILSKYCKIATLV